jgi:hypothetical protein
MNTAPLSFRKSSFSDNNGMACVEVAGTLNALRDSKNPGPLLHVNLKPLLTTLKSPHLPH